MRCLGTGCGVDDLTWREEEELMCDWPKLEYGFAPRTNPEPALE